MAAESTPANDRTSSPEKPQLVVLIFAPPKKHDAIFKHPRCRPAYGRAVSNVSYVPPAFELRLQLRLMGLWVLEKARNEELPDANAGQDYIVWQRQARACR
jgi:hypothetical protein